ncbi:acyl-acyl carrier protein thioesterase TE3, chloroplastic-like isoform X2 [Amaranthus tricolor]|uniref:acyl-acyl carrier protein thioesterase TE3, chloroplastic-like isoform X2 n=1 Tax=Amaranthus tricolor TaxID=29722 RepID=UPI00258FDB4A|nr:acyl-acyl carrier protein thioesterase TE3, chloroplastic-like isoform X2 [Amaranthus tricolor]
MVLLQVLSTFTPTNVVSSPKTTPFPIRRPYLTNPLSLCHPSCYVISNPSPLLSSTPRRFSTLPSHANKFSCVNDRITGVLEMELKVRDYELDQYGVVNNAVYSSYCQLATHELGRVIGLNDDVIQNTGAAALSKFSITFLSPLKPIVEAKAVIVLLDKNHRPARIPEHVKSKAKQFMSNESSTMDLTKSFATI